MIIDHDNGHTIIAESLTLRNLEKALQAMVADENMDERGIILADSLLTLIQDMRKKYLKKLEDVDDEI